MKAFSKVLLAFGIVSTLAIQMVCAQTPSSTGINNPNPSPNAALDIKNDPNFKQGILIPRMLEKDTFSITPKTSDDLGLMFFDITNNVFQFWNGTRWNKLGSGGGSSLSTNSWGISGNKGTSGETNFIGTTDNVSLRFRTNNETRMHIDSAKGSVGIGMKPSGTYILEIAGNLKTSGITETSDIRWKKDIKTLSNSLEKVGQLRGVTYNWRKEEFPDKNFESKEQIGLIAQEVEKIYPQLVDTDALGFKSVQYSKVVALLIEALKEQQMKINSLSLEVSKLSALEGKVNALTTLVEVLAKQNPVVETRK